MSGQATSPGGDETGRLQEAVRDAWERRQPLRLEGGGTQWLRGEPVEGEPLALDAHRGVVRYEPSELVVTARAGTPLAELEQVLAEAGQHLPFEPPRTGPGGTLGGAVAVGASGPARPFLGACRDFVLGVRILNGRGDLLRFGGEVMKNVAGYDVSRLMVGAQGTLGVLLEISLKVLPRPRARSTVRVPLDLARALERMHKLAARPLPLTGAAWLGGELLLRLEGYPAGVEAGTRALVAEGGVPHPDGDAFWEALRDRTHPFFADAAGSGPPLWRISVPSRTPPLDLDAGPGGELVGWGGAERWVRTGVDPERLRTRVAAAGGHATLWQSGGGTGPGEAARVPVLHPLPDPLHRLHERLKLAFDPNRILNPGRLYRGL